MKIDQKEKRKISRDKIISKYGNNVLNQLSDLYSDGIEIE